MVALTIVHKLDLACIEFNLKYVVRFFSFDKIYIITKIDKNSQKEIERIQKLFSLVEVIDEDHLLTGLNFNDVEKKLKCIAGDKASKRTGWYFQQFIKLGFARFCKDEYYFQFDADIIFLRRMKLFDKYGNPYINIRTEFNEAYFVTNRNILDVEKQIKSSFITETMLFNVEIVKKMLDEIEKKDKYRGTLFWEKILWAIPISDIGSSGFSEYELYGNYVMKFASNTYHVRKVSSLRDGKMLLGSQLSEEMILWAAKSYDYIGFEKWQNENTLFIKLNQKKWIRKMMSLKMEAAIVHNLPFLKNNLFT